MKEEMKIDGVHRYTMSKGELTELEHEGRIFKFDRSLKKDTQPITEDLRDIAEKRSDVIVHIDKGKHIRKGKKLSIWLYEKPLNALEKYKSTHAIAPEKELLEELRKWHKYVNDKTLVQYLREYLILLDETSEKKAEEQPPSQDFSISKKHKLLVTEQDKDKVTRTLTKLWNNKEDTTIENIRNNTLLSDDQLGATIDVLIKEGSIKKSTKQGKKCFDAAFGTD